MNTTVANDHRHQIVAQHKSAVDKWASLDGMEGVGVLTGEWYNLLYRGEIVPIGTEGDGRGGSRYVFNHPRDRDARTNRLIRFRRDSKVMIEADARKVIDELLDNQVRISREEVRSMHEQLDRFRRMEEMAVLMGLELEPFLHQTLKQLQQLPAGVSLEQIVRAGIASHAETTVVVRSEGPPASPGQTTSEVSVESMIDSTGVPEAVPPGVSHKRRKANKDITWPSKPDFLERLWTKRGTQIARELGCRADQVFAKADELRLQRPDPLYWARKKYGDPIEIPETIRQEIEQLRKQMQTNPPNHSAVDPKHP